MMAVSKKLIKPGSRLSDNLTVLGIIDGGSNDPVYLVWNRKAWCPMACKVFTSSPRAQREAGILGQFSHPNIVRVLGLEAPVHLLMPFLEGPTLAGFLDRARGHRVPVDNAIRLAVHIGCALQYIHALGYIHLDVKPANIIISRGGLPILFDFGSARAIAAPPPAEIIGTDAYMSPEACRMAPVGPSADVFGLAVVLFEMITGAVPFHVRSRAKPFPQIDSGPRTLKRFRTNIPKGLDELVAQCLSRDPAGRPMIGEFLPALNALIRSGPKMWPATFDPR
jgi:eukaryotic-like serine/threonine-protein kinase